VELEVVFLHPEYPMKLSDWEGLSDERNMTGLCNGLCHPRMEGKATWETVKILFLTILVFSDLHDQCIIRRCFLCSPSFRKSQDEIFVKGGRAVTSRILETLIKFISN
jgi:hypothetical protein